jgi:hypothetical protein
MMEPTKARERNHLPVLGQLDRAARRRVVGVRQVRSVLVVELRVLASASEEVTLAEHEHMIGQLAAEGADEGAVVSERLDDLLRRPLGRRTDAPSRSRGQ